MSSGQHMKPSLEKGPRAGKISVAQDLDHAVVIYAEHRYPGSRDVRAITVRGYDSLAILLKLSKCQKEDEENKYAASIGLANAHESFGQHQHD